ARWTVVPLLHHFIADAPDEDTGMIAIAQYHVFEIALVPLVPVEVVVIFRLRNLPHIKRLIHDDEAHAVGEFEQFRRGRIVRSAETVHAHTFQHLQLPLDSARVHGGTERTEIVMIASPADLHRLAVEKEPLLDVETKGADTESSLVTINHSSALFELRDYVVDVRTIIRPKHRRGNCQRLAHLCMQPFCGDISCRSTCDRPTA